MFRFYLLLFTVSVVSAATVNLEWDGVSDPDLGWYELGHGPATRTYTDYTEVVAPDTVGSIVVPDDESTFISVRAIAVDRDPLRTSAWSNEVVYLAQVSITQPMDQFGLWATAEEEVINMALVGQWTFANDNGDDDVGTFDMTEIGDPSYAATPAYIDGKIAELDGNDAFVNLDSNVIYDNSATSAFSFTGWFYADSLAKGEIVVINYTYAIDNTIFLVELQSDGDAKIRIRAGSTTDTFATTAQNIYVAGRWVFFAITYDDSDDSVEFYTDTTTDQSSLTSRISTTHSTGGTIPETESSYIMDTFFGVRNGATHTSRDSYFIGDIADFRLYDTALTSSALEDVRDEGAGSLPPIQLGSTQVQSVHFGSTEITEIHFGSTQLWP